MNGRIRLLSLAVRVALGGIFVYAGMIKISDPVGFAGSIAAYRILPYFSSYLLAAILPWVELTAGVLMIIGLRVRGGALLIGFLNVVFIGALASAAVRGLDIDCGCFKEGGAKVSPLLALLRDLVFLAMAVLVFATSRGKAPGPAASVVHCDRTETPGNQM